MALPTTGSTAEAGTGFIKETMGPSMEPLKAAGSALGNPLQTLQAPPVVMAAAAAMGTMFSGESDTPEEKLKDAGKDLSGSSDKLDESAKSLGLDEGSGLPSILDVLVVTGEVLENLRDSFFGSEKAIEKSQEWLGKIFRQLRDGDEGKKIGGAPGERGAPQGQIGGIGGGFRKKVDPTSRLRAIEEKREAARAAKGKGKGGAPGAKPAKEMDDISYFKNAMKMGIMKLLGPVIGFFKGIFAFFGKIVATAKVWGPKILKFTKGFGKLMGKLFLPITILIGAVSMITGFIEGFKEGGIIEGFKQGFMNVIDNLIDMPLNLIKDMISWIAGVLGFDEFAADLDSFEFDFSGLFGRFFDVAVTWVKDTFNEVWPKIKELFTLEGMIQFFEGYIATMYDAPLNWIKGLVASVLRFFGAEDAADSVDEFEFDLSGGVRKLFTAISDTFNDLWVKLKETLAEVWETIKSVFTLDNIKAILAKGFPLMAFALGKLSSAMGGGDEEAAASPKKENGGWFSGWGSKEPEPGAVGVQELDEGLMSKVSAIVAEAALQAAENTASAQGGGVSVSTSSVSNQNINQSSAQTVVSAAIKSTKGEDVGMQV